MRPERGRKDIDNDVDNDVDNDIDYRTVSARITRWSQYCQYWKGQKAIDNDVDNDDDTGNLSARIFPTWRR